MIRRYTFNPPINRQAGDSFERAGRYLIQKRGVNIVGTWDLLQTPSQSVDDFEASGSSISTLYLEVNMPGQNVSMTNVRENQATGVIIVDFSSGTQLEFANWEAVGEIANNLDATPDLAEKILLGKAYRASPDGTNKTTQVGASVSVNLLANEPVVHTGASQ